ncbi:hypothetical protein [Flavobacterium sp. ACN6]|uniref:hypothetical protein n=1 Tax=Flavobacterium sp. ACN6 TaxID=1920426 RepID=UPI000BB397F3|nr:hypothetical protein [Flavobacterium sp. ACN6]PBJ06055.1 hypothetical protein BSF42_41310 [Flavobacterium sp. ACN6]
MFHNAQNKTSIWKQFAEDTNGTFIKGYSSYSDSVKIGHKNWNLVFDNFTLWSGKYSTEMTRIIVPITLKDNFKFEIYSEGFIRKVGKIFGAQDIEIGIAKFDKSFTIKSNNEFKIKSLLRNSTIRNLLLKQKDVNIQISDQKGIWEQKMPEDEFELSYYANEKINDLQILKQLLELFQLFLDELVQINTIYK